MGIGSVVVVGAPFFWLFLHDVIAQTHGPVSREEAQKACPISLPPTARNVQYASLAGGLQTCDQYVRFEAPVADCYSQALLLFAAFAEHDPDYTPPSFLPVAHPGHIGSSEMRTDWFDIENISEGVAAGEGYNRPRIWIDTARGVFYYHLTD